MERRPRSSLVVSSSTLHIFPNNLQPPGHNLFATDSSYAHILRVRPSSRYRFQPSLSPLLPNATLYIRSFLIQYSTQSHNTPSALSFGDSTQLPLYPITSNPVRSLVRLALLGSFVFIVLSPGVSRDTRVIVAVSSDHNSEKEYYPKRGAP